ncbi:TonB-dependent receptor [Ramlibacter algicola]|uniref:TonB-dependent receptor n=1 Tax=Ramlibacter algicola TaxID=2795217 RepID=UPI003B848D83
MPARRDCIALLALACAAAAQAQSGTGLAPVTVQGTYQNAVGTSDAASQGVATSTLLQNRPTLRPAEILEFVPGLIVTQHSGDGKANQYFLRGFNLDHGTDFATWVDGVPVNMVSHAHGQGYTDLNFLLPELVERIAYQKGPYYASEGDFSSAGAAHIRLVDSLAGPLAQLAAGQRGYRRGLVAGSTALSTGTLLYAGEAASNDGPWTVPERFRRHNAVLRFSQAEGATRWSLTGMAYDARWNATDQIPLRAVEAGTIDRFGVVDPSDGGKSSRASLSWAWQRTLDEGGWLQANAYAVRSRLDLFSNFTYLLDHPADDAAANASGLQGDQFAQAERRRIVGGSASGRWHTHLAGREGFTGVGVQVRQDRLDPVGLFHTEARQRVATVQESRVRESSIGAWASNDTQWLPWLRSIAGVRHDRFDFDVASSIAGNSGARSASITSPKLSLVLGPWSRTEFFVNSGYGFHSNDARGTVATLAPREPTPVTPVTPLVRTRGSEVGVRTEAIEGLQSSLALWQLRLGSELVFSGDAGDTEPSRASRRSGIEWNNHWRVAPWLMLDADFAWSRARFTQADPAGDRVPGAPEKVASIGATVTGYGPWSGHLQLRYFGPRPLLEDDSRRSSSTTLAYLRIGYQATPRVQLTADVFNLFNRRASDIEYFYASRLAGEPLEGVEDLHFHPVEPRTLRLAVTARF